MKRLSKMAVAFLLFAFPVFGQINGVPASVTSQGVGRSAAPGVPASVTSVGRGIQGGHAVPIRPSVTSLGPYGYSGNPCNGPLVPSAMGCTGAPFTPNGMYGPNGRDHGHGHGPHHGPNNGNGYVYVPYAYPYYGYDYGYDQGAQDPNQAAAAQQAQEAEQQDQNRIAPTIFDNGQYMGPQQEPMVADAQPQPKAPTPTGITSAALPPMEPTVLVFRDGHQVEVRNYAIVGNMLYDIGGSTAKKIKIADLDLQKTQQVNDERGVEFQLPNGG